LVGISLRPEEFTLQAPGRVVRSVLGHWTFQPEPLPPVIVLNIELMARVSVADQAFGWRRRHAPH
jgi:hypothetical protein